MLPFRRVGSPLSYIPSHDQSPSASEEAWEPEAGGLLCMASVGEDENNLNPLPVEALEGGSSSHTDTNLTFKVMPGVQV